MTQEVKNCNVLLLDFEGTTTSIQFNSHRLFTHAMENLKPFLESKWETDLIKSVVEDLRKLAKEDEEKKVAGFVAIPGEDATKEEQIAGLVNNFKWQMKSMRKGDALCRLQCLIWQQAFCNDYLKGHVYLDVPIALKHWRALSEDRKVYVFNSGTVRGQKLYFEKSDYGDVLQYIDGHFDNTLGSKQDVVSYQKIIEEIGVQAERILFLTNIVKAAKAAVAAGMRSMLVLRFHEEIADAAEFTVIKSLLGMFTGKRKLVEESEGSEKPSKVAKIDELEELISIKEGENIDKSTEERIIEELLSAAAEWGTAQEKIISQEVVENPETTEVEEEKPKVKLENIVKEEIKEEMMLEIEIDGVPVTEEDDEKNSEQPALDVKKTDEAAEENSQNVSVKLELPNFLEEVAIQEQEIAWNSSEIIANEESSVTIEHSKIPLVEEKKSGEKLQKNIQERTDVKNLLYSEKDLPVEEIASNGDALVSKINEKKNPDCICPECGYNVYLYYLNYEELAVFCSNVSCPFPFDREEALCMTEDEWSTAPFVANIHMGASVHSKEKEIAPLKNPGFFKKISKGSGPKQTHTKEEEKYDDDLIVKDIKTCTFNITGQKKSKMPQVLKSAQDRFKEVVSRRNGGLGEVSNCAESDLNGPKYFEIEVNNVTYEVKYSRESTSEMTPD